MPNDENTQQTLNQNSVNNSNVSTNSGNSDDFDFNFGSDVGTSFGGGESQARTGMFLTPDEEAEKEELMNSGQSIPAQMENNFGENNVSATSNVSPSVDVNINDESSDNVEPENNIEPENTKFDDKIEDLISFDDPESTNAEENGNVEQNDDWLQQEDKKVEETFGAENNVDNQSIDVNESPEDVAQNVENLFNNTTSEQVNNNYVPNEADFSAMSNLLNSSSTGQVDLNAVNDENNVPESNIDGRSDESNLSNNTVSGIMQGEGTEVETNTFTQDSFEQGNVQTNIDTNIDSQEKTFDELQNQQEVIDNNDVNYSPFGNPLGQINSQVQAQEDLVNSANLETQVTDDTMNQVNLEPQVETQVQENQVNQIPQIDNTQFQGDSMNQVNLEPQVETQVQENQVNQISQIDNTQLQGDSINQVNWDQQVDLRNQGDYSDQVSLGSQMDTQVQENPVNQIDMNTQVNLRNQGEYSNQVDMDMSQVNLQNQVISNDQNVDLNSVSTLGGVEMGNLNNTIENTGNQPGLSLDAILDQEIQNMHVDNSNINPTTNVGMVDNNQLQPQVAQQIPVQNMSDKKRKKQSGFKVLGIFFGVVILLGALGYFAMKMFPDKFNNLFKGDVVVEYLAGNENNTSTNESSKVDNNEEGNNVNNGLESVQSGASVEQLTGEAAESSEVGNSGEGDETVQNEGEGEQLDPNSLAGLLAEENTGSSVVSGDIVEIELNNGNEGDGENNVSHNSGGNTGGSEENFDPFLEIDNILGGEESDSDKLNEYISQGNYYKELGMKNSDKKMEKYGEYIVVTATEELGKLEKGEEIDNTVFSKLDEILESLK